MKIRLKNGMVLESRQCRGKYQLRYKTASAATILHECTKEWPIKVLMGWYEVHPEEAAKTLESIDGAMPHGTS